MNAKSLLLVLITGGFAATSFQAFSAESSMTLNDKSGQPVSIPSLELRETQRWGEGETFGINYEIVSDVGPDGIPISPYSIWAIGTSPSKLNTITLGLTEMEDDRLGTVRQESEADLKRRLPLSERELCALNIQVWTGKMSRFATGTDLGLSFCAGATVLPLGTPTLRLRESSPDYQAREYWAAPVTPIVASPFFDPAYPRDFDRQHLGLDLTAASGTPVVSPVAGQILVNRTRGDVNEAFLVVEDAGVAQHVLGHITSDLAVGEWVMRGQVIGTVSSWPGEPNRSHVHWGVNRIGVEAAMVTVGGNAWGWGRAPVAATEADAAARGWVNLNDIDTGGR